VSDLQTDDRDATASKNTEKYSKETILEKNGSTNFKAKA